MAKYNRLGRQSFWYSLGNFFLNFAIAVVWLEIKKHGKEKDNVCMPELWL